MVRCQRSEPRTILQTSRWKTSIRQRDWQSSIPRPSLPPDFTGSKGAPMIAKPFLHAFAGLVAAIAGAHAEGEILITQAKANAGGITPADTAGFPVTLSAPGSYRL